jgi:hypothetical protein
MSLSKLLAWAAAATAATVIGHAALSHAATVEAVPDAKIAATDFGFIIRTPVPNDDGRGLDLCVYLADKATVDSGFRNAMAVTPRVQHNLDASGRPEIPLAGVQSVAVDIILPTLKVADPRSSGRPKPHKISPAQHLPAAPITMINLRYIDETGFGFKWWQSFNGKNVEGLPRDITPQQSRILAAIADAADALIAECNEKPESPAARSLKELNSTFPKYRIDH